MKEDLHILASNLAHAADRLGEAVDELKELKKRADDLELNRFSTRLEAIIRKLEKGE